MALMIFALLAGAVLGQRFNVFVLVPAIGFALLAAIGIGLLHADRIWSTVLMAATVTASLQIGYLAGIGLRAALAGARTARLHAGLARARATQPVAHRPPAPSAS
jgi:hypothetical protein